MKMMLYIVLLFAIIPTKSLSTPPDLPDNWVELAKQTVYYDGSSPEKHACMIKQLNLPFQEMNCWRLNIYFGVMVEQKTVKL